VSTTAAIVAAPARRDKAAGDAEDRLIAAAMSAALNGGRAKLTIRSRQGGRMRSRQSRNAPTVTPVD
jgi:hypothetical protein